MVSIQFKIVLIIRQFNFKFSLRLFFLTKKNIRQVWINPTRSRGWLPLVKVSRSACYIYMDSIRKKINQ